MENPKHKRFALIMATKDSDYVKKKKGGYYNVYVEALMDEGETWDMFRVVDGEFPKTDDLFNYDGFIISGSPHDAYGNEPWILKLRHLLQILDTMRKPMLGICFGHQVICQALGGKVGKAAGGWDIGLRKIEFVEELPPSKFLQVIVGEKKRKKNTTCLFTTIIEIHQDEVWEVPVGAQVIAFSDKTGVEMFIIDDHVLGIQGHPEYSKDILCNIVDRLVEDNTIQEDFAKEIKVNLEREQPDRIFLQKICKSFLKGM